MTERLFDNASELHLALAGEIADRLEDGVVERGQASLVVTGGSTPAGLYDELSMMTAPWKQVWVTLSDERWLPADHPESNEALIRARLLRGEAAAGHLIPLKTDDPTPAEALEAVDARIAAMPRPFDAVLLGMGADGHFASLFPGTTEGLDPMSSANAVAVSGPGAAGSPQRLSLSLSALLDSRWIALLIRGQDKLDVSRNPAGLPVAALLTQAKVPIEVFWAP
jgi:6-phosphogluconolactonase